MRLRRRPLLYNNKRRLRWTTRGLKIIILRRFVRRMMTFQRRLLLGQRRLHGENKYYTDEKKSLIRGPDVRAVITNCNRSLSPLNDCPFVASRLRVYAVVAVAGNAKFNGHFWTGRGCGTSKSSFSVHTLKSGTGD